MPRMQSSAGIRQSGDARRLRTVADDFNDRWRKKENGGGTARSAAASSQRQLGVIFINKDITTSDAQYIAHQCNCTTTTADGVASTTFTLYPRSDTYSQEKKRTPGTLDVFEPVPGGHGVINCYAQYHPSRPSVHSGSTFDSPYDRVEWFKQCLKSNWTD